MVNTAGIIEALEQQLACYQRLARLAESQRDHVQQGSVEALLELLRQRQAVLDELSRSEAVLAPIRPRWAEVMRQFGPDARGRAEALVAEARRLLEQITRSDQDDVMLLQQRKLNVGRQIGATVATRQVHRAYAGAAYAGQVNRTDVSQ